MGTADAPLVWQKSSRSSNGANCVEVATTRAAVLTRDSKNPTGPTLTFGPLPWAAFLGTVKSAD